MLLRAFPVLLLVVALMAISLAAACGDQAVQVLVDNKPVEMDGKVPMVLSEDVGVPVRTFAEMAGATVDWDDASGTLTVNGSDGVGVLTVGSRIARINGRRVYLPYPPFIMGGRFQAPVLFFNEMFDQAWYWDPLTKQFRWYTIFPRFGERTLRRPPMIIYGPGRRDNSEDQTPPEVPSTGIVVGEVVRVLPSDKDRRIVVVSGGRRGAYAVLRDAIIVRGPIGGNAAEVPLGAIRPGDRVHLRLTDEGQVVSIRAQYRMTSGVVRSVAGQTVLLESGETLKVLAGTRVVLPGNLSGDISDIQVGDKVVASVSPISGSTYVVRVMPKEDKESDNGTDAGDDQVRLNTYGPLQAGDTLTILFRATPGGEAWFTIPGARANIPMTEVEPGEYKGDYVVAQGDITLKQPVRVTFSAPTGESYSTLSRRPVTFITRGGALPRITYPRQGQQITSPLVVRGFAQPESMVRVTIEFRRVLGRNVSVLPLEGLTASEIVKTNDDGSWQTPPMPAVALFSDRPGDVPADFGIFTDPLTYPEPEPTRYIITATSIAPSGQEIASYSIEVTKEPGEHVR